MWNTPPRGNVFTKGRATVPSGEPGSRDKSELRERERSQLCVRGGLTEGERTFREDWPVVDGGWKRAGAEDLPCELVREWRFSRMGGVTVKQLRSRRKAGRARSVPGTQPDPGSRHQMLGRTPHKENSRENSRPRAGFNGRCGVVQEEERTKGQGFRPGMAFYRRGRVRGWRIRRGSLMEVELEWSLFLGARETLLRGGEWLHFP
jgi:hypothetical protein